MVGSFKLLKIILQVQFVTRKRSDRTFFHLRLFLLSVSCALVMFSRMDVDDSSNEDDFRFVLKSKRKKISDDVVEKGKVEQ